MQIPFGHLGLRSPVNITDKVRPYMNKTVSISSNNSRTDNLCSQLNTTRGQVYKVIYARYEESSKKTICSLRKYLLNLSLRTIFLDVDFLESYEFGYWRNLI